MASKKPPKAPPAEEESGKAAEKRVAKLRERLKKSLEDPMLRDQMVKAIRTMMDEK